MKSTMVKTLRKSKWVHFGAGNIFRGFPATLMQDLLERKSQILDYSF